MGYLNRVLVIGDRIASIAIVTAIATVDARDVDCSG